jgi:hypothetical protein
LTAFTYLIAWLRKTASLWIRERQQASNNPKQYELADGAMTAEVYRGRATPFLLPPL